MCNFLTFDGDLLTFLNWAEVSGHILQLGKTGNDKSLASGRVPHSLACSFLFSWLGMWLPFSVSGAATVCKALYWALDKDLA